MAKSEKTIENSFKELDEIMIDLENGDTSLEDSFLLYQKGIKLLKTCNDSIDKVEKKIMILNEDGEAANER